MLIASVFVNIPVKSIAAAFSYSVPAGLREMGVGAGWRVFVPFGGRKVEGFVIAAEEKGEAEVLELERQGGYKLKEVLAAVDEEAWFTPEMLQAARWLASFYLCSLAEIMRLFMPGKSGLKITVRYLAEEDRHGHLLLQMPDYRALYRYLLAEGPKSRQEIAKARPELSEKLKEMLAKLIEYKIISRDYRAVKREAALYEQYLVRMGEPEGETLADYRKRRKAQARLLDLLAERSEWRVAELKEQGVSLATVKQVAAAGWGELRRRRVLRDSYGSRPGQRREEVELTEAQQQALAALTAAAEGGTFRGFLLKGVTGSGKTQVYIEIAQRVRALGRQVIVLVPEIALTGQVVRAFQAYFPEDIVVLHSRLSLAERNDACLRVRRKEAGVIIGARSALFTPAADIGLIVLDEEQDMSYKQDESPRYQAKAVAEELAGIHQAVLLLGSATPSIESYYRAERGELTLLALPERIGNLPLPRVECVDMREELRHGNRHIISGALRQLLEETLARHEQAVIMLNRRGYSTFVMCRACGEVLKCKLCGLPLVYHRDGHLACHHCDVQERVPDICPKCGSRYIKYFGSGTEKLEQELRALLPSARVIRMDRDTTGRKFAHADILGKFRRHEYDILLGTQMVAKGHDIPNVTAVGIISADSSLNMPDFRAAERCFMLITQTAGRAGRHGSRGRVVIQTYNPGHYAVAYGIAQDYEGFYRQEIALRRELFYPPFSRLVKLIFQGKEAEAVRERGAAFVRAFGEAFPGSRQQLAIGPVPAAIACLRGTYRFVVLIKTGELQETRQFLRSQGLHLRRDVAIDIDPIAMF